MEQVEKGKKQENAELLMSGDRIGSLEYAVHHCYSFLNLSLEGLEPLNKTSFLISCNYVLSFLSALNQFWHFLPSFPFCDFTLTSYSLVSNHLGLDLVRY